MNTQKMSQLYPVVYHYNYICVPLILDKEDVTDVTKTRVRSRRGFWDIEPFASPAVSQTRSQWRCTLFAVFRITAQQLRISTMSIITLFIIASFWSVSLAKLRSWSRKREVQTQRLWNYWEFIYSTEHFTVRQTLQTGLKVQLWQKTLKVGGNVLQTLKTHL